MVENYTRSDKVRIVVDIIKKLKKFPATRGGTIDLFIEHYCYIEEFKEITNKWINEEFSEYNGKIHFHEINKYFEYKFPSDKSKEPLFVLRHNKFFDE